MLKITFGEFVEQIICDGFSTVPACLPLIMQVYLHIIPLFRHIRCQLKYLFLKDRIFGTYFKFAKFKLLLNSLLDVGDTASLYLKKY